MIIVRSRIGAFVFVAGLGVAGITGPAAAGEPTGRSVGESAPAAEVASPPEEIASPSAELGPPAPAPTPQRRWYGGQTLMVDGISTGVFLATTLAAIAGGHEVLKVPLLVGIGGYLLPAPIVHLVHGRPAIAAVSFGLRVGVPAVLGLTVLSVFYILLPYNLKAGLVVASLTIPTAMAIDAFTLAYERVPAEKLAADRTSTSPFRISPVARPRPGGGVELGVGGTF